MLLQALRIDIPSRIRQSGSYDPTWTLDDIWSEICDREFQRRVSIPYAKQFEKCLEILGPRLSLLAIRNNPGYCLDLFRALNAALSRSTAVQCYKVFLIEMRRAGLALEVPRPKPLPSSAKSKATAAARLRRWRAKRREMETAPKRETAVNPQPIQ